MDPDFVLVIGVVVCAFSVASMITALMDRETPRMAAISAVVGGVLIIVALRQAHSGYSVNEIAAAFARVIVRYGP